MRVCAILTAAGLGERLGANVPKALVPVNGKALVAWAFENLAASGVVGHVIVTCPPGFEGPFAEALGIAPPGEPVLPVPCAPAETHAFTALPATPSAFVATLLQSAPPAHTGDTMCLAPDDVTNDFSLTQASAPSGPLIKSLPTADPVSSPQSRTSPLSEPGPSAELLVGGGTRQESVAAALAALPDDCEIVLVHDAARPFASPALVQSVVEAVAAGNPAVIPGIPVADTIKRLDHPLPAPVEPTAGGFPPQGAFVVGTEPRELLAAIQTPQGFRRDVLERAHKEAEGTATDDAALVEALGEPVLVIAGEPTARKITTPQDLAWAENLFSPI